MPRVATSLAATLLAMPMVAQNHRWRGPGDLVPPANGRTAAVLDEDLCCAVFWWELSRDALLPPRDPAAGPNSAIILADVVPALRAAAMQDDDRIAAASLVALAKVARHEPVVWFRTAVLAPQLSRGGLRALAATFALGIAADGSAPAVAMLREVACSANRPLPQRAAALTSLGLVGRARTNCAPQDAVLAALLAVGDGPLRDAELGLPFVRALGGLQPTTAAARQVIRELLLRAMRGANTGTPPEPRVAAHALTALAQFVRSGPDPLVAAAGSEETEQARELCRAALDPRSTAPREVAGAAALALGTLGAPHDDLDADDELLLRTWREHRDAQTRSFAMLALGGRGGAVRRALVEALPKAQKSFERPWVAMAMLRCAAAARAAADGAPAPDESAFRTALQRALDDNKDPATLAAEARALGFCGSGPDQDPLALLLPRSLAKDELGGAVCLALALRHGEAMAATVAEVVACARRRPELLRDAATALAIAAPQQAGSVLLPLLDETPVLACQGALAQALGATRDARLIAPLCRLLAAAEQEPSTRAAAAVALGCLCDRQPRPWNAELAAAGNYRAATCSLLHADDGAVCWW